MLFALPDDSSQKSAPQGGTPGGGVELDTDLSSHEFLNNKKDYDAMAKVELDLEGAPFLVEEERPGDKKKSADAEKPLVIKDASEEKPGWAEAHPTLKKILIPKISVPLLIVIIAAVAYFFFIKTDTPPPPPPPEKDKTALPESVAAPKDTQDYALSFEPFWVEQTDADGNTRFLIFKFTASSKDEKVRWEATRKILLLRDAVFYYLRHKNLTFLSDTENVAVMKHDLLGILNGHLSSGTMDSLLIESYLVK